MRRRWSSHTINRSTDKVVGLQYIPVVLHSMAWEIDLGSKESQCSTTTKRMVMFIVTTNLNIIWTIWIAVAVVVDLSSNSMPNLYNLGLPLRPHKIKSAVRMTHTIIVISRIDDKEQSIKAINSNSIGFPRLRCTAPDSGFFKKVHENVVVNGMTLSNSSLINNSQCSVIY